MVQAGPGYVVDLQPDLAVAELLPWLYLGSQDVAGDEELLRRHQITHILNVGAGITIHREQWSWRVVERRVELLDTPEQRIDTGGHQDQGELCIISCTFPAVSECNEFLQEAETGRHNKVLVHCNAGVSRS